MGYLNLASYEKLVAKRKTGSIGFASDSFSYKADRTLTLGKNASGTTLHVYLKDSVLHAHEYLELPDGRYFTVTWLEGTISPIALSPSFYAIPLATDEMFADLMVRFSHPLDFAEWRSGANLAGENFDGFFGRIVKLNPETHPERFS